jgi:hypothetical protein
VATMVFGALRIDSDTVISKRAGACHSETLGRRDCDI